MASLHSIHVKKLFGYLSYTLEDLDDFPVMFFMGDNGLGKSTILGFLDSLTKDNWKVFDEVEYEELKFEFRVGEDIQTIHFNADASNEIRIGYSSRNYEEEEPIEVLSQELNEFKYQTYYKIDSLEDKAHWWVDNSDHAIMARCNRHFSTNGRDHLKDKELLKKLKDVVPDTSQFNSEVLTGVTSLLSNWKSYFISAKRMYVSKQESETQHEKIEEIRFTLRRIFRKTFADSFNTSINLNNKFFNKVLTSEEVPSSIDDINKDIKKVRLIEKQIETFKGSEIPELMSLSGEEHKRFASYFIQKRLLELKPHTSFFEKAEIFDQFVNSSMQGKKVLLNYDKGLVVQKTHREDLEPDQKNMSVDSLSSGEQQLVVMGFYIVFEIEEGSLVLLDEPEISMHLNWQQALYPLLNKISELRTLKFLCATHSPLIVQGRKRQTRHITFEASS